MTRVLCLPLLLLSTTAQAQPPGVEPGESYHRIFVTSTTYGISSSDSFPPPSGFINGPTGADWNVTMSAFDSGLLTSWNGVDLVYTALLSTSTADANTRFTIAGKIYNTNDEKVADDATDFWNGSLDNAIKYDEYGVVPSTPRVWSGSLSDGNWDGFSCHDWTDSSRLGGYGIAPSTSTFWLRLASQRCNEVSRLYGISPAFTLPDSADFNNNNAVDGGDFLTWQRNAGTVGPLATHANGDANGDDSIEVADLAVWELQYGGVPPLTAAVASVPEPTTYGLCLVAAACLLATRKV